jgi:hypothetical protein
VDVSHEASCLFASVCACRQHDSRALAPLYFYDGKYTTEPKPGARPIARVWRNPAAEFALDREAAAGR